MHFVAFCARRIFENNGIALLFGFVEFYGNHDLVKKTKVFFTSPDYSIPHRSAKIYSINRQSFFALFKI